MKKSKFDESQIVVIPKEGEAGAPSAAENLSSRVNSGAKVSSTVRTTIEPTRKAG